MNAIEALELFMKLFVIAAWIGVIGVLVGISLDVSINLENEEDSK